MCSKLLPDGYTVASMFMAHPNGTQAIRVHPLSFRPAQAAAQWLLDADLQASRASWRARREEARARCAAEQERESAARKQTVAKCDRAPGIIGMSIRDGSPLDGLPSKYLISW